MGKPSTHRHATYDDLLAVPEPLIAEIVDGELVTHPRPALPHAYAASALSDELGPPFRRGRGGPGGWVILFEPELRLEADVLVPDLAGWRVERMPPMDAAYAAVAPDWVCEVLSPATAGHDRIRKMIVYAREQVRHVWLLDPEARTLEVFRLEADKWLRAGAWEGDAKVRAEPFGAVEMELVALWPSGRSRYDTAT